MTDEILSDLHFPDGQDGELVDQINSALNAGKHIVFTGPPGTGKTEIARRTARYLAEAHPDVYTGFETTTATADWSTFETVGGYMPEESGDGDLEFEPGQVLRRFKRRGRQRNEPLVIDEINRSDIDKSFGQLFTLLSGQAVQLPFKLDGEEIEVLPAASVDGDPEPHQYVMPKSWRVLATMNTYDKTSLYEMSYAFMRRFAFVYVDAPDIPEDTAERTAMLREFADGWDLDPDEETLELVGEVWLVTNTAIDDRQIGPAIVKDVLAHAGNSGASRSVAVTRAVANYVFPQLEGVPNRKRIVTQLSRIDALDTDRLAELGRDVLQVTPDG